MVLPIRNGKEPIYFNLEWVTDQDSEAIELLYNQDSGLKGVCGENDMREVLRLAMPATNTPNEYQECRVP